MKNSTAKIRCVVVDDDELSISLLGGYITNTPSLNLVASFTNPLDAINYLQENEIDLLFTDIHMPMVTGLELVKSLDNPPKVIMTTSSLEHAIEAFETNVADYLLKPVPYDRFLKACKKLTFNHKNGADKAYDDSYFVKVNGQMVRLNIIEILYIEAYGDYVKVHTLHTKHVVSTTMKEIEEALNPKLFSRIHRSYIVALDKIEKIINNEVIIKSDKLPISNSFKDHLLSLIKTL
ncbi:MAG TPA: LytTR family DNA-binding domain-containing protein [Cytophagaceae bacterium]